MKVVVAAFRDCTTSPMDRFAALIFSADYEIGETASPSALSPTVTATRSGGLKVQQTRPRPRTKETCVCGANNVTNVTGLRVLLTTCYLFCSTLARYNCTKNMTTCYIFWLSTQLLDWGYSNSWHGSLSGIIFSLVCVERRPLMTCILRTWPLHRKNCMIFHYWRKWDHDGTLMHLVPVVWISLYLEDGRLDSSLQKSEYDWWKSQSHQHLITDHPNDKSEGK